MCSEENKGFELIRGNYNYEFNGVVIESMCMCRELRVMKVEKNTSTYSARVVIHNNTSKPLNANSVKSRTNP